LQAKPNTWEFAKGKSVEITGNFQANNIQSVINATSSGLGISFVPEVFIRKELQLKQLKLLLPSYTGQQHAVYAYYQRSAHTLGLIKTFISYLKASI
jgi:DNA-binding transcriptional LysR family regulator